MHKEIVSSKHELTVPYAALPASIGRRTMLPPVSIRVPYHKERRQRPPFSVLPWDGGRTWQYSGIEGGSQAYAVAEQKGRGGINLRRKAGNEHEKTK